DVRAHRRGIDDRACLAAPGRPEEHALDLVGRAAQRELAFEAAFGDVDPRLDRGLGLLLRGLLGGEERLREAVAGLERHGALVALVVELDHDAADVGRAVAGVGVARAAADAGAVLGLAHAARRVLGAVHRVLAGAAEAGLRRDVPHVDPRARRGEG